MAPTAPLPAGALSAGEPVLAPAAGAAAESEAAGPELPPKQPSTAASGGLEAPDERSASASSAATSSSAERMARLRQLVRQEGRDTAAAAREVGVDPIIAQLWLRLPDDLWPASPSPSAGGEAPATSAQPPQSHQGAPPAYSPLATSHQPLTTNHSPGLRRILTCRVPLPAYDRLRGGEAPLLDTALQALQAGLALPLPDVAPGGWRLARRPLALPVPAADFTAVLHLAHERFDDDPREAAGWLIARGLGMALPLPTADELAGLPALRDTAASDPAAPFRSPAPPIARFVVPPRRRPEMRTPLPADDSAPSGDELRSRREAIGISQRDLAAASGLSRGLVAEVERGRRRHVLTRLKLAETLASLARSSGKQAVAAQ